MAHKVLERKFKKLDDGKFEIYENRELSFPVDPVDVVVNLKNMKSEIEKAQNQFPQLVKRVEKIVDNYNTDLKTMQEAKEEIGFEEELPEVLDKQKVLEKLDISKL